MVCLDRLLSWDLLWPLAAVAVVGMATHQTMIERLAIPEVPVVATLSRTSIKLLPQVLKQLTQLPIQVVSNTVTPVER
jgi:hypothetical protein